MSAWYHKLLPAELQKLNAEQVAQVARDFAHGPYAQALEKGDQIPPAEHQKIVKEMARLTGLSPKYIESANLRVSPQRWFKELMRDKRRTCRPPWIRASPAWTPTPRASATNTIRARLPTWARTSAMFQDYVRRDLKWNTDGYYTATANVRPWDQGQPGQPAEALRSAMTEQGDMKLLVICGYYDLATPFQRHRTDCVTHDAGAADPQERELHVLRGRPHDVHRQKGAREAVQRCDRLDQRELLGECETRVDRRSRG
jgi:carboxypeptidase C (cathepsin A)